MMNLKDLTVIILTYHTPKKIILDCLKSINKNTNILIIENSTIFEHNKTVLAEFPHARIICTGQNLGYGAGNNFGIKNTKTDYALILNPDVICHEDFFYNIPLVINEAKDFVIIGCQYLFDKVFMPAGFFSKKKNNEFVKNFKINKVNSLSKVEWVTGCSMLLNLKEFENRNVFDENFFLYFEEFDLCKSMIKAGKNIYTSNQLKVHHLGFNSSVSENHNENFKKINIKNWHYMWSSFYFYKKNYNYLYALSKILWKFIKSFFKMIFYSITFQKEAKQKYLYRFLGLLSSILGRTSNFRG
jgi:N-acetylglucosaminyl-diphospho-decaprenol L-rhamnosyltransferase